MGFLIVFGSYVALRAENKISKVFFFNLLSVPVQIQIIKEKAEAIIFHAVKVKYLSYTTESVDVIIACVTFK